MSHRLQVLVPESVKRRIAKAAARHRQSHGAWVRDAIERALTDGQPLGRDPLDPLAGIGAPTAR